MPLVGAISLVPRKVHRHRGGLVRACLEELDRARHHASARGQVHLHAHARLADVGARPPRAVVLVDHDRAAHDPHAATAARGRIKPDRRHGVHVRCHVCCCAYAQQAELPGQVAHLAAVLRSVRRARVLELGVVVASRHVGATHLVHSARCGGGELVHVPLVARAFQARQAGHDGQVVRVAGLNQGDGPFWIVWPTVGEGDCVYHCAWSERRRRRRRRRRRSPSRRERQRPASQRISCAHKSVWGPGTLVDGVRCVSDDRMAVDRHVPADRVVGHRVVEDGHAVCVR